jgi:predicted AlkP superfamily phosphohydrolase/phosphomutase
VFLDHFRKIDHAIGEIVSRISDDDLLIMHSDHGFEKLDNDIFISYILAEEGLLKFKQDQEINLKKICYGTKAFVLDPARVYLNLKDKYPCGTVDPSEAEDILKHLEKMFSELKIDGKPVIRDIYRKEQIYSGPYLENAPDLILVGAEGFNLKANLKTEKLADRGIFTGKHTQDTAFLIARGLPGENLIPPQPAVSDIKTIIEKSKSC